jgi:hypothetical protein
MKVLYPVAAFECSPLLFSSVQEKAQVPLEPIRKVINGMLPIVKVTVGHNTFRIGS